MAYSSLVLLCITTLFPATFIFGRVPSPSCNSGLDRGPCKNFTVKWYYDHNLRQCHSFYYGGCQGNGNRFDSLEECKTVCDREEDNPAVKRCLKPFDKGTCNGSVTRWYYDTKSHECICGIWSGCGGNDNLFQSYQECRSSCGQFIPKKAATSRSNPVGSSLTKIRMVNETSMLASNITWTKLFHRQRAQFFEDPKSGKKLIVAVEHHTGRVQNGKLVDEHHYKYTANNSFPSGVYRNITAYHFPLYISNAPSRQQQFRGLPSHMQIQMSSYPNQRIPTTTNPYPYFKKSVPPSHNKSAKSHISQEMPTLISQQPGHPAPKYPPQSSPIYTPQNDPNRSWSQYRNYVPPSTSKPYPYWAAHENRSAPTQVPTPYLPQHPNSAYRQQPVPPRQHIPYSTTHKPPPVTPLHSSRTSQGLPVSQQNRVPNYPPKKPQHGLGKQIPPQHRPNLPQLQGAAPSIVQYSSPPPLYHATLSPLYPSYPPPHLYIPQEPYYAPTPYVKQLTTPSPYFPPPRFSNTSDYQQPPQLRYSSQPVTPHPSEARIPYSSVPFTLSSTQLSNEVAQQRPTSRPSQGQNLTIDYGINKEQGLSEKEKKERERRKKLKKDALFAKLKQQEKERWLQLRMGYLKSGKTLPSNLRPQPTTPSYSGKSGYLPKLMQPNVSNARKFPSENTSTFVGSHSTQNRTTIRPPVTVSTLLNSTMPLLSHAAKSTRGPSVKTRKPKAQNEHSDDSYSEEYDEGTDTYDDPLQFFLRMKQNNKGIIDDAEATDSGGYVYADDETDNNWMETDLRPNFE